MGPASTKPKTFKHSKMSKRFNVSLPDKIVDKHAELIKRVSLSALLQEALEREAKSPHLLPFMGEGI